MDPHLWLEDVSDPRVQSWLEQRDESARTRITATGDVDAWRALLTSYAGQTRCDLPMRCGGRTFVLRALAGQQQPALWCDDDVLVDPNLAPGASAIVGYMPSPDGARVAYGVSEAGSNWVTWRIIDVATRAHLSDVLSWSKFSGISWTADGSALIYSRYPAPADPFAPDRFHQLCAHVLGTEQQDDEVLFARPEFPEETYGGYATEDGRYCVIGVTRGHDGRSEVLVMDLSARTVVPLARAFDAMYRCVGNDGARFYLLTDYDAPQRRLVAIELAEPNTMHDVIPARSDALEWVSLKGETFFAGYLRDVVTVVERFTCTGEPLAAVPLPCSGWALGFGGPRNDPIAPVACTGHLTPLAIYLYDTATNTMTEFATADGLVPPQLHSEQVFVTASDGARIPMTLVMRADTPRDGTAPVLLTAYGGFGISLVPAWRPFGIAWAARGGIFAIANIRGGGEYGDEWHRGGSGTNKQRCFDDLADCARWLIENRFTSAAHLAISGASNGGLLIGASITQHPELYGAAHASVGIFDMMRFPLFTIGWAWIAEYGSPDDPEQRAVLRAYSPLHNVHADRTYPPTLLVTGDHDDHVVPMHSYKFAAALEDAGAPVWLRVLRDAGHGVGKPADVAIDEQAEMLAFLWSVVASDGSA